MPRVTLPDGLSLQTRVDGPAGAPWVILSNSLGTDLSMWDGQIATLTRKYRVLRYDQRGHGTSDAPGGPYTLGGLVGDVTGLMEACGIDRADFVGVSMGAMTGMGLALAQPERFGRMVLADARAAATDDYRAMWDRRIATVRAEGMGTVAAQSLDLWFTAGWRQAHPAAAEAARAMSAATDPEGYIACCHALQALDYLRELPAVRVPVLYVCGADDKSAPPAEMQNMARITPQARYVEIPAAGHLANINQPERFNAALAEFLAI